MEFDDETIRAAFKKKGLDRRCPACNGERWGAGTVFFLYAIPPPRLQDVEEPNGKLKADGARMAPRVYLTCGYTQLFDVTRLIEE